MICTPFYLTASAFVGAAPASKIASSRMARVPAVVAIGRGTTFWSAHEAEAKSAWLAKLDAPTWGKAAAAISEVAADAARFAALTEECDITGEEAACVELSKEEEAKRLWLSRIDAPNWGKAAAIVSELAEAARMFEDDEDAKAAWLSRLDFPAWGPAAEVVSSVLADAERFAECDLGVEAACEQLSKEDEAKRLWLSRIDDVGPATWGKVARCLSAGQKVEAACEQLSKEDEAK